MGWCGEFSHVFAVRSVVRRGEKKMRAFFFFFFFLASLPPPAHSPCWESCVLAWVKGGGQDDR